MLRASIDPSPQNNCGSIVSAGSEGDFFELPSVSREAGFSVFGGEKTQMHPVSITVRVP